ncbi:Crp/Fnr family transcriptional regulator [Parapusillimonas sp. SGNA-6]|uniref:Crp/Fnr family transcriptional regulator n=1 Tax=Parapedobacter sp. SGR-10 TaxID=2710879 RepID=UPI0013D51F30|nr:Crp/Fnr family transcriptional regulator [Parapedobacter sp. SGR-10]NGF55399.1 Crp/Fnr family transcriptional regulator [Parapedobacter sp. SGR-10]NGM89243.1 Crp/Fnr family transcriptional regulator [Parapusillimonas sp. SGNA-6]
MGNTFELFLDTVYAPWRREIPDLPNHIERLEIDSGEHLPCLPGDIYFVGGGTLGKYERKRPIRYAAQEELIFVPLERHRFRLLALESSLVYFMDRKGLYELSIRYPTHIILYDLLRERHQQDIAFREYLLALDKRDRLEAFRQRYGNVLNLVPRTEIASFLCLSREYLRQIF